MEQIFSYIGYFIIGIVGLAFMLTPGLGTLITMVITHILLVNHLGWESFPAIMTVCVISGLFQLHIIQLVIFIKDWRR